MFNNPYANAYNPQATRDRIDGQIAQLQQMKEQLVNSPMPQPTNLTQNFQIAPNNGGLIKYATSIEDVQKEMVVGDTPYFSKDMSVLWLKNSKGEIKSYELNEIVQKDEKDLQIEFLMSQVNELKGMIKNESNADTNESVEDEEPSDVQTVRGSKKK